jgi:ubiquinol-cytochrome c reductase cytochrome b subunit
MRACPNHWSFFFGVISVALFTVLLVTGIALMFFYDPSTAVVRYRGSYPLLRDVAGVRVDAAHSSTSPAVSCCGRRITGRR